MEKWVLKSDKPSIECRTAVPYVGFNVTLDATAAVENDLGQKVFKKGTPIGGFLNEYNKKGKVATTAEEVEGLVYYDVVVRPDQTVVTLPVMVQGWVNLDLIDTTVVTKEFQDALKLIGFKADGKGGNK